MSGKNFWWKAMLPMVCLGALVMSSPALAASTSAGPGFGDPINAVGEKVVDYEWTPELDESKCKPGDEGCPVIGYKCYQGAKRVYYVSNSSECGVEDDEYVLDKDGNRVCVLDKDGNCKVDEKGAVVYQRKGTMYYLNIIINVVLGVIGVVAVAMIIIGGISFATSQGDTAKTTKARNTILYSIVGLVVALLAFAIVNFVLTNVFKG